MAKKPNNNNSPAELSFEQSLAQLQTLVGQLEDGELPMDAALAAYEQGIGHLKRCYHLLEAAEQKVQMLAGVDADGNPVTQEFTDDS